ncbi:dystroglycan-like [Dorcoceras hygrometricum]|uniref:Dystroglycan-like n=1 Tax=Dorcoceras hygrometricum TaxID=472368 RepID=A0A2Z7ADR0_9LAMI|nr:dystroglycan-like [Dorcoceras hygrometricum]
MASSLISSNHHIHFDGVFGIDDTGLVQMFETIIATRLKDCLRCPTVIYEAALTEFFVNSSVREGMVVSTIRGTSIEISEEVFSTTFELPTEGLTDLSEVPKDLVSDAQSLFSDSKVPVSISCLKKEMKIQYRLLSDILAKSLFVKAGSFDAVNCKRFMLMAAITFYVEVNWSSLLFCVLKDMVTPGSRQVKGFAIQICVLLKNIPGLELGESRAFPLPRVLNEKTVHRYVTINEKVGMEEIADSPKLKKTPAKNVVSQKRPAVDTAVAPMVKKKRTTKGKPVALETVAVAQEAVALQTIEGTADAPTEQPPVPKRKSQKRKRRLILEGDDEIADSTPKQPAAAVAADVQESGVEIEKAETADDIIDEETVVGNVASVDEKEPVIGQPEVVPVFEATTDDPDAIIEQVLDQLDTVAATDGGDQPATTADDTVPRYDLPFEFVTRDSDRLLETASDPEDDVDEGNQELPVVRRTDTEIETVDFGTDVGIAQLQLFDADDNRAYAAVDSFVEKPDDEVATVVEEQSADEVMSLEDIILSIPVEVPLPSAAWNYKDYNGKGDQNPMC